MQITAQYNHGRWIVLCPVCEASGMQVAEAVKPGDVFVCPIEYPDLYATTLVPNPRMSGAFNSVADPVLRQETRQKAIDAGNVYDIIFPQDWKDIEAELRKRPPHARNWEPGTTLNELKNETEKMVNHA